MSADVPSCLYLCMLQHFSFVLMGILLLESQFLRSLVKFSPMTQMVICWIPAVEGPDLSPPPPAPCRILFHA